MHDVKMIHFLPGHLIKVAYFFRLQLQSFWQTAVSAETLFLWKFQNTSHLSLGEKYWNLYFIVKKAGNQRVKYLPTRCLRARETEGPIIYESISTPILIQPTKFFTMSICRLFLWRTEDMPFSKGSSIWRRGALLPFPQGRENRRDFPSCLDVGLLAYYHENVSLLIAGSSCIPI